MIDKKTIRNLYYQMLRIRIIEEKVADEYHKQEMRCPTHFYIGQEAIATGVCQNLTKKDIVFSTHRSHGHYLSKSGDLKRMIAEIYGKAAGCSGGIGGSQHLIDLSVNFYGSTPVVGETIPVAVGTALATKMRNEKKISVVFFGEAATEEGVFFESVNYAALKKLPVLFICENNLYSVNTPLYLRQPKRNIFLIARALEIDAYDGDGNDVLEVYKLSKTATKDIRAGKGPVLLEFYTYRQREHCGPDFEPPGFRPQKEFDHWEKKSAVKKLRGYILKKRLMTEDEMRVVKEKIEKEIKEAFDFGKESPYPNEKLTEKQVYA